MSWTARWRALLDSGEAREQAFAQGRAFQRSGRVVAIRVEPGRLSGRVQGSRATPYQVEVLLPTLDDAAWGRAVGVIAGQVRFAASLLAGRVPEALVEALAEAGVDLVGTPEALDARCACGEAARPCAHVVALWEQAAATFDDDAFALFALRGRGRQRLLGELLRNRRGGEEPAAVAVEDLDPEGWTEARAPVADVDLPLSEGLADPLRMLGDPPGWAGAASAERLFGPLVERAGARARALVSGEAATLSAPPDAVEGREPAS